MKLGIVGSRKFNDFDFLTEKLKEIKDITEIVSGGAVGADKFGELYAKLNNIPTKIFKPEYSKYGKRAPYLRNIEIVENSDIIIAFWDGKSPGTKLTIDICEKQKKKIIIHKY
jgi:hypothetical protein